MSDLFVAFDFETTGLNVVTDNIVTAAVVGLPHVDLNIMLAPRVLISPEAAAVHGITNEVAAADGVEYAEGLRLIGDALSAAWDSGATVTGHNILRFDLPMLRMQERIVFGKSRTTFGRVMDTYTAYKSAFPTRSGKLTSVCEHLGVELSNAHNAYADTVASREVAVKLAELSTH